MTNAILVASKAKGMVSLVKRARSIIGRYGLISTPMDHALKQFSEVLRQFGCGATFPITAVTLKRNSDTVKKYLNENIEFAVHGYSHVDYSQLSLKKQIDHLQHARKVFANIGLSPIGFRSPYLRQDENLSKAIEAVGFSYVSNQPILWDAVDTNTLSPSSLTSYERALAFYTPWQAGERLSLPQEKGKLVEIPVGLPDDEILIERLGGPKGLIKDLWLRILSLSYLHGELFTLQLHPERITLCADALSAVLTEAHSLMPKVWCARLDEVADWWKTRARATVEVISTENGRYRCLVNAPGGATILARSVEVNAPIVSWADGYQEVQSKCFNIESPFRPLIGLSPSTPNSLGIFLQQQGYFVETSQERNHYSYYIDQNEFDVRQERSILQKIEQSRCPIIRLGRWPNGARSALCVTGDVDALTIWDYGLRLIGK